MMKKIILVVLLLMTSLYAQENSDSSSLPKKEASVQSEKQKSPESQSSENEKKYSAQFILGGGRGHLSVVSDKYDPSTSLSEFVALALYSANLASNGYASLLAGNLGTNALFALYLLNYEKSSSPIRSDSRSSINRFYIENRIKNDSVGLQFGLTSGTYAFQSDSSRFTNVFLPVVFFGTTNPVVNIYMTQSYVKNSQPIYLGIDTFDAALKYHFFPADNFDLYLSAGAGVGSCFAGCTAFRFFGRAGARYNFDDYYVFFEQEIQTVLFSMKEKKYNPLQERISLFGFGFYL